MGRLTTLRRRRRGTKLDPSLVLYLPLHMLDGGSFMSRDAYGRLCTVTGATWTLQGRSFDGTDDFISTPDSADLTLSGDFTLWAWLKSVNNDLLTIMSHSKQNDTVYWDWEVNSGQVTFKVKDTTMIVSMTTTTPTAFGNKVWFFAAITRIGNTWTQYINDESEAFTDADAIPDMTSSLMIGAREYGSGLYATYLNGTIGEVGMRNRGSTFLGIERIRMTTRWRYSE